jgi:hypothetical protein
MKSAKWLAVVLLIGGLGTGRAQDQPKEEKLPPPRVEKGEEEKLPPPTVEEGSKTLEPMQVPHVEAHAGLGIGTPACAKHSFWGWLTYHPLRRCSVCDCQLECSPCGTPRLYIFFLCHGNGCCGANGCGH